MATSAERFKKKYAVGPVVKRYKKLLPAMWPQLEYKLSILDDLELAVYAKLLELGVPSALWPYYMAFAKRKGKKGLEFWDATFIAEQAILVDEFVRRGLIEATLEAIADIVEDWIRNIRGLPPTWQLLLPTTLSVCSWLTVGASPYTKLDDEDTEKIYSDYWNTANSYQCDLENTTLDPPYTAIKMGIKCRGYRNYGTLGFNVYHPVYGWINQAYYNIVGATYVLYEYPNAGSGTPWKNLFTTKAHVDGARFSFFGTSTGQDFHITYAYLRVET